jgi:hypothetical protein
MKQVKQTIAVILLCLAICLAGCSDNGSSDELFVPAAVKEPIDMRVLAKLKLMDITSASSGTNERYGDLVMKYIHPMYKPGELVRISERQYEVVEIQNDIDTTDAFPARDFQLTIQGDSIRVYAGHDFIGTVLFTDDSAIGNLIYYTNN